MRTRLLAILTVLFAVLLTALWVPLGLSYSAAQARIVYIDRLADLTRFEQLLPSNPQDVDKRAVLAELRRYDDLYGIPVAFLGSDGSVTLTTQPDVPGTDPRTQTAVRAALSGQASTPPDYVMPWGEGPLVVAQPIVVAGDVVGAIVSVSDLRQARQRVWNYWAKNAAIGLSALVAGVIVAQALARWVLRPVVVLDRAAHRITHGEMAVRVPIAAGPAELRRLGASFNQMAEGVQASLEAQRSFVADASHQLRNPLGALLVRLEGLTLTAPPEQRSGVEQAADDGRHLADNLDRMLELARAEHVEGRAGPLEVAELVDARLTSWQVIADSRAVTLSRTGIATAPCWHDAAAIAGALDAVLDNALKYGPGGSTITVDITRTTGRAGQPGCVTVMVTDQGPGLDHDELGQATDRFWRSRRRSDIPGTGLGLSIANALMVRHGGDIQVTAGPGAPAADEPAACGAADPCTVGSPALAAGAGKPHHGLGRGLQVRLRLPLGEGAGLPPQGLPTR